MLRFVIKVALIGMLLTASTTPPVITYAFAHGGGKPWFAGGRFDIGALLGFRPQPGWHVRRQASHERNFRRSHKTQRINASLKPHEAQRKALLDQQPNPNPRGNEMPTAGAPPADRAPDDVQAAPAAYIIERATGQTVGMAPAIRSAHTAQNTPPPVIEGKGTPTTRSLDTLWLLMVVVIALGLIELLLRRIYAKHGFAFEVMRRLRPVDLLRRHKNQVGAEYDAVLRAAKKLYSLSKR